MHTSFQKFAQAAVIKDPYPHVIIPNFLPGELADALVDCMPRPDGFPGSGSFVPSKRYMTYFEDARKSDNELLRAFTLENVHHDLYNLFVEKFEQFIPRRAPRHIKSDEWAFMEAGQGRASARITIDGGFTSLAPDIRDTPTRGVHLDSPHKVGNFLIYIRAPHDTDPSGSFVMYTLKDGVQVSITGKNKVRTEDEHLFESVKEIPYTHNTLVAFPNGPNAFHGIDPRRDPTLLRHNIIIGFDTPGRIHNFSRYYHGVGKIRHLAQYFLSKTQSPSC